MGIDLRGGRRIRIDHIAACNRVKLELLKAPKGKPFSINALAEKTGLDWYTVKKCIEENLGNELDGGLSRTTTDGQEIFFLEPPVCDMLPGVEQKAKKERKPKLAEELGSVWRKHCSTSLGYNFYGGT